MLQSQVGDSVFWKSIRTYYARYAGKNASTEDFQKVVEEVSGVDFSLFFRQWLYTAGQPQLKIEQEYDTDKKIFTITITQKQEQLFQFPLELQTIGGADDGRITKSAPIKERQTRITIPMMEKPAKLVVDPQVKLLFEEMTK